MFANIYLNELDQYVKHKLKCKYYYRYMDDSAPSLDALCMPLPSIPAYDVLINCGTKYGFIKCKYYYRYMDDSAPRAYSQVA